MQLTKYEHSCMVIENMGEILVIDPALFTKFTPLESVLATIVTHSHSDHLSADNISMLANQNPEMTLFVTEDAYAQVAETGVNTKIVGPGHTEQIVIGGFKLEFNGRDHAVIYEKAPCQNTGVMINDILYYPGDSFALPPKQIKVLAVPASAPWMKTGEAMDYIKACKPEIVIPVHDGLLSDFGKKVTYNWLQLACDSVGADLKVLVPGDSMNM